MTINILTYLDSLEQRLRRLDKRRRVAFAARNSERLFREFAGALKERIGDLSVEILRRFLDSAWHYAEGGPEPEAPEQTLKMIQALRWPPSRKDEKRLPERGALETLEALMRLSWAIQGGALEAAQAAERVINRLDYEASMIMGNLDPLSSPAVTDELQYQEEYLRYLEKAKVLGERPEGRYGI